LRFPNDELLIVIRGENVLRARKFDYIHHPYAKSLTPASIFDYAPRAATSQPTEAEVSRQECAQAGGSPGSSPQAVAKPKLFQSSKPPQEF
jgi:type IV secretion system protein VirD4